MGAFWELKCFHKSNEILEAILEAEPDVPQLLADFLGVGPAECAGPQGGLWRGTKANSGKESTKGRGKEL